MQLLRASVVIYTCPHFADTRRVIRTTLGNRSGFCIVFPCSSTNASSKSRPATAAAAASASAGKNMSRGAVPTAATAAAAATSSRWATSTRTIWSITSIKPHWNAERGEHGQGADCHGTDGKPCVLDAAGHRRDRSRRPAKSSPRSSRTASGSSSAKAATAAGATRISRSSTNRAPKRANPGQRRRSAANYRLDAEEHRRRRPRGFSQRRKILADQRDHQGAAEDRGVSIHHAASADRRDRVSG